MIWQRVGELANAFAERTGIAVVSDRLPRGSASKGDIVLPLPGYRQVETFSCGFVAVLMVTRHFKPRASVDALYKEVAPDVEWGASTRTLATALRRNGITVGLRDNLSFADIAASMEAGHPIITCVTTPQDSHWAVIYGVGRRPNRVFLAGVGVPHLPPGKVIPWKEFRRSWCPPGNGLRCWRR